MDEHDIVDGIISNIILQRDIEEDITSAFLEETTSLDNDTNMEDYNG